MATRVSDYDAVIVGAGDLAAVRGDGRHVLELGLVYSVEQSWNRQFDDRDSLLNLEHGYIP